ncbi:MAG: flippase [Paraprevotella sp.]|jgi:O-antigen/teichoic acid export membrane protein|uniref:flippase n=1 Tax=Paraprevotella sp. TaxID=2049036 RepID=UPI00257AD9FB|nr:flippase [Paraprevotella sp.]MBS4806733.1 flippase [Paraprevotella sp.]
MASIKKNFFYSSILTTANYIFPFLTYPYVSRVLGVNKIGACNFVDSIIHYFILISMLGISSIGIREIAKNKRNHNELSNTFNNLFWLTGLCTLIATLILLIFIYSIPQLYAHKNLMLIGGLKLISNFLLIEWLFKGLEDFKYITQRTLIVKCIYVICVFCFVREQADYPIYYLLLTLMISLNALCNCMYARKYVRIKRPKAIFKYMKPFAIMGLYAILTNMYTTFTTAFLGFKSGETHVGYFSTATKIFSILISLYTAFTGVMLPRMSSLLSEGRHEQFRLLLNKSVNILMTISIPLIIFSTFNAPDIINVIAGNGYEGAILPMQICMPLIFIIGYEQITIVQGLLPLKKDKAVLINSVIGAFIGIVGCFVLIPNLQSIGASLVWLSSEICVLLSAGLFMWKYEKIKFPFSKLIKMLLLHVPLCFVFIFTYNIHCGIFFRLLTNSIILFVYCFILQYFIMKQDFVINIINNVRLRIKLK